MRALISVIVPVYGTKAYLERCIQSIVGQTYRNLEVVLVDDGSTDGSGELCDDWQKRDARVRVIHQRRQGLSEARNTGIRYAQGEWIGFVDSDDWIHEQMYEKLAELLEGGAADLAVCGFQRVESGETEWWEQEQEAEKQSVNYPTKEALKALIQEKYVSSVVWNKLYRRTLLEGIWFPKGKCHEDEFWTYQVMAKASNVAVLKWKGYYYVQRADSIMGHGFSEERLDGLEGRKQRLEFMEQYDPELARLARLQFFFFGSYLYQCSLRTMRGERGQQLRQRILQELKSHPLQKGDYRHEPIKKKLRICLYKKSQHNCAGI